MIADKLTVLLETRDLEVARDVLKANSDINDLHLSVFKAIAAPEWAESPATTVDVALASRYFERFADHGVSVAQKVTYLVTGAWQLERQRTQLAAKQRLRRRAGHLRRPARRRYIACVSSYRLPWLATARMACSAASGSR